MDVRTPAIQVSLRRRDGLFKERPALYILILLGVCVAAGLYKTRADSIFACQASGYTSDRYLGYCDVKGYGDYEHGAFWFDLEPAAEMSAARADVLFLGSSRMQFAFSTAATAHWFASGSSYYLLGFIGYENSIFAGALLHKLKPRAEVYIINLPEFFQPFEAPLAKMVMHDAAARTRYEVKHLSQIFHRAICGQMPAICGRGWAIFRSRQTGFYAPEYISLFKLRGNSQPVSYDQKVDQREIDEAIAIGRIFLSELPARAECVILTAVPTVGTRLGVTNAIARGLGKRLVVPQDPEGLQTFDGSHLDEASAQRWSEAFFETAGPRIKKCLATASAE